MPISKEQRQADIKKEIQKFEEFYLFIEEHMPPKFFDEVGRENVMLVAHNLMDFHLQGYFSNIHLPQSAIVICLDSPDADVRILKQYRKYGIKNYRAFLSNSPPPFDQIKTALRIAVILFTQYQEKRTQESMPQSELQEVLQLVTARNPEMTRESVQQIIDSMNPRFIRSLNKERLILALDMYYRAKTRDMCQYEVRYNEEWKKTKSPSMQIVLAWKHVPKHDFLYRLAKMIHRHSLVMQKVNSTYVDPYSKDSIILMSLGIHGSQGNAAWEAADIKDFLRELVTIKFFEGEKEIEQVFVDARLVRGNIGNLIKSIVSFVHQILVHLDPNIYSFSNIEEGICRHPELTIQLTEAFEQKFDPQKADLKKYESMRDRLLDLVDKLDTGQEVNDTRRKNIFKQAIAFVDSTLKTNFYRNNKTALSFRLDPIFLSQTPYDRTEKFPELPFALFFIKGGSFIGFHIRFVDLARGGVRTVYPEKVEQYVLDRGNTFAECYGLAFTQQKKNKDIPEGGAKAVILLEPYGRLKIEEEIYARELQEADVTQEKLETELKNFHAEQKKENLYQAQRSFVEALLVLINCEEDGRLRAKDIVDYYGRPEYIYLGPDENMFNEMIEWISTYSQFNNYKPGRSFISSKPGAGINHKEFGVTSFGVNVYMEELLKFLQIDPYKDPFTIKMTGGPDGDVAGNQILNLYRFYPQTAHLLALIDGSGTIFDPKGLDLEILAALFKEGKAIRFYPAEHLHDGGFLVDTRTKKEESAYAQKSLCLRKKENKVVEEWLSGSEMNHLLRHNVHQTKTDIFIPAGGRPKTVNDNNWQEFLDETGTPTSKAIVEGANLYLTPWARRSLEKLGLLIIKDSSANKGGVICSSFEVLAGLTLSEKEFLQIKTEYVKEVLEIIRDRSKDEADLLLKTHSRSQAFLTDISEWISQRINSYTYQLLSYLETIELSQDPHDPLIKTLIQYCPKILRTKYRDRILSDLPDIHKKAIIACSIASRLVYKRGLDWSPTLIDVLPLILED